MLNKSILVKKKRDYLNTHANIAYIFKHSVVKKYYLLKNYDWNSIFSFLCTLVDKDLVFDRQMINILATLWINEYYVFAPASVFSDSRSNYTDYLSYPIFRVLPKNGKIINISFTELKLKFFRVLDDIMWIKSYYILLLH